MLTDLKNSLNLSEDALTSLEQALQPFNELDSDFSDRLLCYLVDGDDEAVIEEVVTITHQQLTQQSQMTNPLAFFQSGIPALFLLSQSGNERLFAWLTDHPVSEPGFYARLSMMMCGLFGSEIHPAGAVHLPCLKDRLPQFLQMMTQYRRSLRHSLREEPLISADIVDALYVEAGEPAGALARVVYCADPKDYQQQSLANQAIKVKGFVDYSLQHASIVQEALQQPERDRRIHALQMLRQAEVPIETWVDAIATLAVSSSKKERESAADLLKQEAQAAMPLLQAKAESGSASERQHAVKLLWDLAGAEIQPFLESRLEVEKAAKVHSAIEQFLVTPTEAEITNENLSLPPLPEVQFDAPVPKSATNLLRQLADVFNQHGMESCKKLFQVLEVAYLSGQSDAVSNAIHSELNLTLNYASKKAVEDANQLFDEIKANPKLDKEETLQRFRAILDQHDSCKIITPSALTEAIQHGSYEDCWQHRCVGRSYQISRFNRHYGFDNEIKALFALSDLKPIHAIRLLILTGHLIINRDQYINYLLTHEGHDLLLLYRNHHPDQLKDLRELAAVLEALQISSYRIGIEILDVWGDSAFWRWGKDAIWPYFAERSQLLEDAFAPAVGDSWSTSYYTQKRQRKNAFRILKAFPQPPAQLLPLLWKLAFEGAKNEREIVQDCLNEFDETLDRVLAGLTDPNRDMRTIAAEWLGNRGDVAAIAPLKQALKKEKSDAAKDIMLRSLEKLGASVDEFLDRDNLLKDSQKLLQKGIPAALKWFPFNALPIVHWQDTGQPVATDIIKGLLLQCWKQKTPEPGPILKRYVEMWKPDEREVLGQFILESWIAHDTAPAHTPQEADQQAQKRAQQDFQYYQQYQQQYPNSTYYQVTYDELYQRYYNELLNQCLGSAIKEKGILAIAAACCGTRAIAPINHYLTTWYGMRMAQCKALLQVLAWTEHNSAIQLLLSVANRFRTKGIQKEAEKLVTELAERNSWSRDELSDRTIPTAGFDQGIEQSLDYGSRQFTLLLDADMSLVLKNPDGKVIKSLPAARKDDDPEQVKAAKKQLADSRKQLKQVLKMQRERLYEAMCTQRAWSFADWDTYLNQHPIVGRYCQQLIWAIYDGDVLVQTFRPLEDRTLTDADDEEVTPAADATVRLAHSCTLPADVIEAWQTHLADYEVPPLLQQFPASSYALPDDQQQTTELTDFKGYLIEAFQLRGLATKRGYTRGQTEDAGWFYDYRKSYTGLGIEAVINFSGNYLPEENRTVALIDLAFYRLPEDGESAYLYHRPKLSLSNIPPVLLSESWNDLQTMAHQGSGYDADWEKKVEY